MRNRLGAAVLAVAGLAVGIGATLLAVRVRDASDSGSIKMDINAQILKATPARELVVMNADARVFSGAQKAELLGQQSRLYYVSRARFTYSVDLRALTPDSFAYDPNTEVLKVKLPTIKVQSSVYGPRERIASLALLASEGGSGNELERKASAALEKDAAKESVRPELLRAATDAARYQVSKLYEDAFRAAGSKTQVVVLAQNEPLT